MVLTQIHPKPSDKIDCEGFAVRMDFFGRFNTIKLLPTLPRHFLLKEAHSQIKRTWDTLYAKLGVRTEIAEVDFALDSGLKRELESALSQETKLAIAEVRKEFQASSMLAVLVVILLLSLQMQLVLSKV